MFLPDGTPLRFERSRAKEIFAYLIHRCGSRCSTNEIAAAIFEDEPYDKTQQSYVQTLISAMDEILVIQKEGKEKRVAAQAELAQIEDQLKAKLLEASRS